MPVTKTIDQHFSIYRAYLLGLRPDANVDQTDSDWWIRGRTVAGVASGLSSDIEKVGQDAFPQNARREAMLRHLFAWFAETTFKPATVSSGPLEFTGGTANAGPFTAGLQATYAINGNVYVTTEEFSLDPSGNGSVNVQSIVAGQAQNLQAGAELAIGSPPSGLPSTGVVGTGGLSDGTNEETEDQAAVRVLARMRSSARGGNETDYKVWALSVTGVTGASVLRFVQGLGTVGIIITSGTTDVDAALDAQPPQAIDFTPSVDLIADVQAFIRSVDPTTDCAFVYAPVEVTIPVTVACKFKTGDKDTILSGQTPGFELTQGQFVEREVKRAIYKAGPGGTRIGTTGYMLKKDIEDMIDSKLSAQGQILGETLQIVVDRVVTNLDGVNANFELDANELPLPGTITITNG